MKHLSVKILKVDRKLTFRFILAAFHYAKDPGNFGQNSNGKVRFGFFLPEYSRSPLELVHIFWWKYSDRYSPFHFLQTGSMPLIKEFVKIKNDKSRSYWLAPFNRKMSFHFLWYFQWYQTCLFGIIKIPSVKIEISGNFVEWIEPGISEWKMCVPLACFY